jgi:hypothetical protein
MPRTVNYRAIAIKSPADLTPRLDDRLHLLVGERLAAADVGATTCGMVTARGKAHLRPETAT